MGPPPEPEKRVVLQGRVFQGEESGQEDLGQDQDDRDGEDRGGSPGGEAPASPRCPAGPIQAPGRPLRPSSRYQATVRSRPSRAATAGS